MDVTYACSSMEVSLMTICAVKAVSQILLAGNSAKGFTLCQEEDARRELEKLCLPTSLKELMSNLIKPVNEELGQWYNRDAYYPSHVRPIFTPRGTLDVAEMAKLIIEDGSEPAVSRFVLACAFCQESQVLQLFKELSPVEVADMRSWTTGRSAEMQDAELELVRLWLDGLQHGDWGKEGGKALPQTWLGKGYNGRGLPPAVSEEGFRLGLKHGHEVAVKYFVDKAPPGRVRQLTLRYFAFCDYEFSEFSPSAYHLLNSKLGEMQQSIVSSRFSLLVLVAHLKRPYQQAFLETARPIVNQLTMYDFRRVLENIAKKMAFSYKDYDYRELFVKFWELRDIQRLEFSNPRCMFYNDVFNLFMARDKWLVGLVLDKLCPEEKRALLLSFRADAISAKLACKKDFQLLQLFVRECALKRKDVLEKFLMRTEKLELKSLGLTWLKELCMDLNEDNFGPGKRGLLQIVKDIMAE